MKLFFASDIHGSLVAAEKVIELYLHSKADHLILLGDLLNHGPRNPIPEGYDPAGVAQLLNQYSEQIIAVRGNCDSEVDQMLLSFPMMSDYAWILLESGHKLFLTHGHLYTEQTRPSLGEKGILVHGHTHIPVAHFQENNNVFNPGSVTFPREGYPASYAILEDNHYAVFSLEQKIICQVSL
ncbi:YfcE family phosphodiesterase [Vibrio sp. 10N.286.49.B3]|uniref:phosphodiesterase n=1 Tax=Vibrio sp. 10N.286.49.B3 TaxID=1880855 RepID=UPI000C852C01|nr:phosphodiesterase [Vibrio sp. 10N.286.49.B3]PMH46863.1 YfcE family phosphodiesterase [Vibrio sp. 10N.286.49.B3]